ncbi:sialate O-acetylesterase [Arthrobacter sp. NPDC058130]|uniref:sialate O-acetylesterase n=1 Tax=Arthrobacter sp. NPDC058130 TaxID=3346353 RepID=UPI0036F0B245
MAFVRSRPVSIFLRLLLIAALTLVLVPVSPPQGPAETTPPAPQGPAEPTPSAPTGDVTVLHVFLAAGQSNMSGRGLPAGGAYDPADPRIFQFGAKIRTFRPATVPLDMHDVATGISPATTFAREYLKTQPPNVGVLIIPAAHGATAFTTAQDKLSWSVGVAVDPEFDLPALAVAQTLQGMAAAKAAGYSVDLKGVLWHQGESNSAISMAAYAAKLDELIAFFRSRLLSPKLPFVVGGLAPEGIAATPGAANIDRAHRETPSRVAYTGFAKSMAGGVNPGERIHFSRVGIEFLGKSYLSAYRQALRNTAASPRSSPAPRVTVSAKQLKVTGPPGTLCA